MAKTLDLLKVNESTKVISVSSEKSALRRRLLDMGLTPNTQVKLIRLAPLGDPMELEVRGYALTIRKEDAKLITVE